MTNETIKVIKVDGSGVFNNDTEPIEMFTVNGEMAPVNWYRQGKREWNGKYVVEIEYE